MGNGAPDRVVSGQIQAGGRAIVRLRVSHAQTAQDEAKKHDHDLGEPQIVTAVVDTGCSGLEVSQDIAHKLGIMHHDEREVGTAGGTVKKWYYLAKVEVLDDGDRVVLSLPEVEFGSLPPLKSGAGALAGWCVLSFAELRFDGPARRFRLDFATPHP